MLLARCLLSLLRDTCQLTALLVGLPGFARPHSREVRSLRASLTPVVSVELSCTEHLDPDRAREESSCSVGTRIRAERTRQGIGVRELARLAECSPSLVSQIELGRANPSVSTLYSLAGALNISVASLFAAPPGGDGLTRSDRAAPDCELHPGGQHPSPVHVSPSPDGSQADSGPARDLERSVVLRRGRRRTINLERGVHWELLLPIPEREVDFMEVVYQPFGGSTAEDHAIRHRGREMAVILGGVLSVQIGFEQYDLDPGDSLSFESTIPHRFWNSGAEPVRAIFVVLGRW